MGPSPINAPTGSLCERPSVFSVIDGLMSATLGGKLAMGHEAGKCPEWQRELTVNQPPHGFEGSSPSFPTNLRPWRLRVAQPDGRAEAHRAKTGFHGLFSSARNGST